MQVEKNKVVSIDYTLKDDEGNLLDSSEGNAPLAYLHGKGNIIPGLENELEGKQTGDSLSVRVEPKEGYGERNDALTQVVPRQMFQGTDTIEVGMQFHAADEQGNTQVITVTAVDGDDITVDGNHPLAGVALNFDVKVVDVRDATEEEMAHGHAHGAGGHQH